MSLYSKIISITIITILSSWPSLSAQPDIKMKGKGLVAFYSEAPHEKIEARSNELLGVIDWANGSFYFVLEVKSFEGFNSTLQREHFNENYMESKKYRQATFTGKIIEDINFSNLKSQEVRAKGKLNIHGIDKEVILPVSLIKKGNELHASSKFTVLLSDYNIKIPRIVTQKLSPEIDVNVNFVFKQ